MAGEVAKATVRRGRPPLEDPKVLTTISLSKDVIERFKAGGRVGRRGSTRLSATGSASTTQLIATGD